MVYTVRTSSRGATVLEMVVVLAIIILFAGIVAPEVKNYFEEAKAAKVLAVYRSMADGAMKFWEDTGEYGVELSTGRSQGQHTLFYKPNPHIPGWSGAYIDHPLAQGDNPFRREVFLHNSLDASGIAGLAFDLDFDGIADVSKDPVNFLVFELPDDLLLDDPVLFKVDRAIDGKQAGDWKGQGRAMVLQGPPSRLVLYVFKME